MKLYYSPGACSMAPHIVLREAGVAHALEPVDLKTRRYKGGDYARVNPKGYVPALELEDGQLLTEVGTIIQYVADLKPEKGLMPQSGAFERYRAQEWINFISSEIHKSFSPLWRDTTPAETREAFKETLAKRFDHLSERLKSNQFLMGDRFMAPDAYLFTVLNWSPIVGVDLSKWPALMGFMERVKTRPAVREAMKDEGLVK